MTAREGKMRRPFSPISRSCRIPVDLSTVTSRAAEGDPGETGVSAETRESLWRGLEDVYRSGLYPAMQLALRLDGRVVLDRAIGHSHGNDPDDPRDAPRRIATTETPMLMYSASKGVTAMLVHKLDEIGQVRLDDRIVEYVPEFGKHGKDTITIRHLLAHRAGIPAVPPGVDFAEDPGAALAALCDVKPTHRPGRYLAYHAISGGFVLGEVVRRATGEDIRASVRRHFADPLGLRWMNYGVPPDQVAEVADDSFTGPPELTPVAWFVRRALGYSIEEVVALSRKAALRTAIIPSANLVSTASEMAKWFAALASGGEVEGVRICEPRTIRRATAEQSYYELDWTLGAPTRWGLGLMLGGTVSLFGWDAPKAFGHLGFTNTLTWGDPERGIAVALTTTGKPWASIGLLPLAQLVLRIAHTFPPRGRSAPE